MSDDDLVIPADAADVLRGLVATALDREGATAEDREAARLGLVGALDYLLRERDQRSSRPAAARVRGQQESR